MCQSPARCGPVKRVSECNCANLMNEGTCRVCNSEAIDFMNKSEQCVALERSMSWYVSLYTDPLTFIEYNHNAIPVHYYQLQFGCGDKARIVSNLCETQQFISTHSDVLYIENELDSNIKAKG